MQENISVVCTVFNDQNEIENLLDDINLQEIQPCEIVIADGGSKDNTIKIINDYKKNCQINIKLIYGERLNISQGFNKAIKNSENDIIVIMSTGNKYDKNFIKELIKKHKETKADIVFAPIRGNNSTQFSELYNNTFLNGKTGSRIPSNHGVLVNKSVFKKIGLFYEKFIYAGEDAEFFERARNNKLNAKCAENAKLQWDVPNNIKKFKKQVKAYTIAKMQIESTDILKKYKKDYCDILLLILFLTCIALKQYYMEITLIVIYILNLIYRYLKGNIKEYMFLKYRRWLEMKTIMCNLKVFSNKYRVNIEFIEKL